MIGDNIGPKEFNPNLLRRGQCPRAHNLTTKSSDRHRGLLFITRKLLIAITSIICVYIFVFGVFYAGRGCERRNDRCYRMEYLSGVYAAAASICGKLSLTATKTPYWLERLGFCSSEENLWTKCWVYVSVFRLLCFSAMFFLNILQLSSFLKALERKGSLPVTVVSSAVSFILTGILGSLVLDEKLSFQWLVGAGCVAAGVALVAMSQAGKR